MLALGAPELLIIAVLIMMVFGLGRLPRVMGDLGKGMRELRDSLRGEDRE